MSATAMTFVDAAVVGAFEDDPQNVNEVFRTLQAEAKKEMISNRAVLKEKKDPPRLTPE